MKFNMKPKAIGAAIFYACEQIGREWRDRQAIAAFVASQRA